jgi:hypothetical protein
LSWFLGAETRAILTMSSSALGVTQVNSTFMSSAGSTDSVGMDQCTEQYRNLCSCQQL